MVGSSRGHARPSLLALIVTGTAFLAAMWWAVSDLQHTAWQRREAREARLAAALEQDAGALLDWADSVVSAQAVLLVAGGGVDPALAQAADGAMLILDRDGHARATNCALVKGADATLRGDGQPGVSVVPLTFDSSNGLAVVRRFAGPGGVLGVAAVLVNAARLNRMMSGLEAAPGSEVALVSSSGQVVYAHRWPENGRGAPRGLVLRRPLGRFGLELTLAVPGGAAHAPWWKRAVLALSLTVALLVAGGALLRHLWAEMRARSRAEQEARRVAELFEMVFDSSADALFLLEATTARRPAFRRRNPAFRRLGGEAAVRLDPLGGRFAQVLGPEYAACVATRRSRSFEVSSDGPDGDVYHHVVLTPVCDADGAMQLVLGCARDVTEQRRGETQRLEMGRLEAVGRLTAGVAHDFNNALQTIVSSLETLTADYLPEGEARGIASAARVAAQNGALVTHRLLAFSRQQVLQPCRVNVATLVRDTRALLDQGRLAAHIGFKIAVEPFTDDILVDQGQAQNCLLNLLVNAVEAMPDGGNVVVHARNAPGPDGEAGPRQVVIAVHDTGCGMDEAVRARAFEPFFTTKAFGTGAGLGLSMAQGFSRQSGGDIRLLSGGAVGTRVELWLPAAPAGTPRENEAQFNLATIGRSTGRLLLVEDEADVAHALTAALVSGGFEVVAVRNAADGLQRLQDRDPYDALLTDYSMPDMTGAEFLTVASRVAPRLPALMLTGFDPAGLAVPGLERPVRLLRKPISRSALLNEVRGAIGDAAQAGEAAVA